MTPCKCSHARRNHTAGSGQCWQHPCGCKTYRPDDCQHDWTLVGARGDERRECAACGMQDVNA